MFIATVIHSNIFSFYIDWWN